MKSHRTIVLDTLDQGKDSGLIGPAQLSWLAEQLRDAQSDPVIVILHHNICDYHVQTDFIRLKDNLALVDVLNTHGNVRQVVCGHVHMTTTGNFRGRSVRCRNRDRDRGSQDLTVMLAIAY